MRLFIAINFPADMRGRLWDATSDLRDADYPVRWVRHELLHLTVKFLGEVDQTRVPAIEQGLRGALDDAHGFRLPVRGFGAFPNAKRPRVIWAGCEHLPALELMFDAVERAMSALTFPIDGRAFRPHVTLGRTARSGGGRPFRGLAEHFERIDFHEEPAVSSVDVMCSSLGSGSPRYERLASIGLPT